MNSCGRIVSKVKSCFDPQTVDAPHVRSILLGTLASTMMGQFFAYMIIQQDVAAGELDIFTIDFLMIGISLLEVLLGPFISWFGYNNKRIILLAWNAAFIVITLLWMAMPGSTQIVQSEYCHGNNTNIADITTSPQASIRLSMLTISCIVFSLGRIAAWSHGIAYMEEHAPSGTILQFGILVTFRVVGSLLFPTILPSGQSIYIQVFALIGSTIANVVQVFLFMPKQLPTPEENSAPPRTNRGYFASAIRVMKNTIAMSQMVAIGLLATALWGYAYYETEIIKVKYHLDIIDGDDIGVHLKVAIPYLVVIMSVLYVGVNFSAPILPEFCRLESNKQATLMSVLSVIFYILLTTMGNCDKGQVAGLGSNHYTAPACSVSCGCIPRWREFSPVCIVDQAVTYLSPCQAGCSSSETFENIRVFTNCTCAPGNGRAAMGACSLDNCSQTYQLHRILFVMVVMTSVLAFHAQGLTLLRSVDLRDRSVALGVAGAVVSSIMFGCGHPIYMGITAASCTWFEAERCHLYGQSFPIYMGSAGAVMAFLSVAIGVAISVTLRLATKQQEKETDLASPEERILMEG